MSSRGTRVSGLNRREWTKRLAVGLAAVPVAAQSPSPATPAATPEQRMQKAQADIRAVSDQLSKLEVPMDVEPAFAFRPSLS